MSKNSNSISDARKWEFLWLGMLAIVGSLLALRVSVLFNWAWSINGSIRQGFYSLVAASGFNLDILVLFPLGVILGWITLFSLDETKRAQKPLLIVSFTVFVSGVVLLGNRWTLLEPGRFWYAPLLGGVVGILSGWIPWYLSDNRYREFPVAAWALFLSVTIATIIGVVDLYIFNTATELPQTDLTGAILPPTTWLGLLVDMIAAVSIIILFGTFLLYRDHHNVLFVGPERNGVLDMTVLTGIFTDTENELEGTVSNGISGRFLGNSKGKIYNGNNPNPIPRGKHIEFSYFPNRTWARRRVLSAQPVGANQLKNKQFSKLYELLSVDSFLIQKLQLLKGIFIPQWLANLNRKDSSFTYELANSDVVVMVVSMDDLIGSNKSPTRADDLSRPDYLNKYQKLTDIYTGNTPTVVAILESELLEELYRQEMNVENVDMYGPDLQHYLSERVLQFDPDSIIPIQGRRSSGSFLEGTTELRKAIDENSSS